MRPLFFVFLFYLFFFCTGEFNVGLGSMLAVRGEGILSWVGDDNFVVEEKTGGNQEVIYSLSELVLM